MAESRATGRMMTIPAILLLEAALLALCGIIVFFASLLAVLGFRLFGALDPRPISAGPKVSIILPVRNEADTLALALESLTDLAYANKEVIVVCGPSTDGTEMIAEGYSGSVTVVHEPARPNDWLGKSWACHQGYLRATGDVFLFTDGDVTHSRGSLSLALANLESRGIDLLSVWPKIVTRTISERVLLPVSGFFLCLGIATVANKRTPRGRRVSGANGQYIMIKRTAYEAVGGHQSVKDEMIEDGAIGKRVLENGFEVVNANGEGHLEVRPYSNLREIWEAHEKFGAGLVGSAGQLAAVLIMMTLYFIVPFVTLGATLVGMSDTVGVSLPLLPVGALSLCALTLCTSAFFCSKFSRPWYFPSAPIGAVLVAAAFCSGFIRFRRRGITWKGVGYRSGEMKPL